jgi:hypothetical protein
MSDPVHQAAQNLVDALPRCACGNPACAMLPDGSDICPDCMGDDDQDAAEFYYDWHNVADELREALDAAKPKTIPGVVPFDYDGSFSRTMTGHVEEPDEPPRLHPERDPAGFFDCDFCGTNTNARLRKCCALGYEFDGGTWPLTCGAPVMKDNRPDQDPVPTSLNPDRNKVRIRVFDTPLDLTPSQARRLALKLESMADKLDRPPPDILCPKCGFDEHSTYDIDPPVHTCGKCKNQWTPKRKERS